MEFDLTIKSATVDKLHKQTIKSVMDVLVLAELRNENMSGYDAISYIHEKFGVLVSSGTVYSHLYALERDGLIKGDWDAKKRVYTITEKGEQSLETIAKNNMAMLTTLKSVLNP